MLKSIELHTKKKKKVTILYNHLKYKISKILIQSPIPQLIDNYFRSKTNKSWESNVQHDDDR